MDHGQESNDVNYCHTVKQAMGAQCGGVAMILTKRVDQPANLKVHAEAMAATATIVDTLFPAGSEGGQALPIIWEEPDEFAAKWEELVKTTAALAAAAAGDDPKATAKAFKAAGASCKGCHERYQEGDAEKHAVHTGRDPDPYDWPHRLPDKRPQFVQKMQLPFPQPGVKSLLRKHFAHL